MITIVVVEIVCAVFLAILFIGQIMERGKSRSSRLLNLCILLVLFSLIIDGMAYTFMDATTPFAFRYIVCLLAYCGEGIYFFGFSYYSEEYFTEKTEISPWLFRILRLAEAVWLAATAVTFFAGKIVVYENGVEVADNGYPLYLSIYQIIVMLYTPVVAYVYRKKIGKEAVFLLSFFNITPILGILSAIITYYDYSYVLGAVVLVFITELLQRKLVQEQKDALTRNEGLVQNNNRFFALEDDFESLYDVELESGHYTFYDRDEFYKRNISDHLVSPTEFFKDLRTNIDRVVYEEDREALYQVQNREAIIRGLSEKEHIDHYYRIITEDGTMWLKMRIVYKDADRKNVIVGVFNAEEEMTAILKEKQLREELIQNNARLFALEDNLESLYDVELDSGHYNVFVKGDFFRTNVLEKLSVPKDYFEELRGNIDAVIYPEDREGLYNTLTREAIRRELTENEHFDYYYRIVTENGPVWFKMRIVYKDATQNNIIIGAFNAARDVEARQVAEQKIQLQKALDVANMESLRNDLVIEQFNARRWSCAITADNRIASADYSEEMTAMVDISDPENALAWIETLHPEDRERVRREFLAAVSDPTGETQYDTTFRVIDRDGNCHWTKSSGRVFRRADGSGEYIGMSLDITRQMEEQQKRLLGAVALSPDVLAKANIGMWAFELDDGQAPRMYADETMLKLVGLDHQVDPEEIYHAWYDHIDAGAYGLVEDAVAKMSAGEHAEVQYPWHHPDGHTLIVRCGGIRNPEYTKGIRIEGTHQDVTETLHFDEEQQKQKEKEILEPFMTEYNLVYRVNLADASFELLKIDEGIIGEGMSFADFRQARDFFINEVAYESDREKLRKGMEFDSIRERLTSKTTYSEEYRAVVDGVAVWHEMTVSYLRENEVVIGFAIKDTEVLNRHISKSLLDNYDAIYVANLNTDQMKVLKASGLMLNKPMTVVYSKMIRDFASGLGDEAKAYFEKVADIRYEKQILAKDGKAEYAYLSPYYEGGPVWLKCEIHVLTWANDEPETAVIGITTVDSLQREKIELDKQLQAALDSAQVASQAKTEFLFNMSHDIRTPMNAILGYTDIALNHINEAERVSDSLKKIKSSGGHLLSLINDILEMSRIEAGRLEIVNAPLNAYEVTEGVTNMSKALAATKDITFRTDIGEMKNPYVYADELHTNQVIINLISNAIKYTNPGGTVDYRVEQVSEPVEGIARYCITVQDTGIGISEEFQPYLFESFAREQSATVSRQEGAGLGLAIVKRILDLIGGTIQVKSKPGEGSTFVVELPLRVMDDAAIESFRAAKRNDFRISGDSGLNGRKILLVEDNEMNREIAKEILEEVGLIIDTAEDGAIAVKKVMENGTGYYDFILMDIQMPVMNGYEATKAIRKLPNGGSIPIIALSANAFEEDKQKSVDVGMNAHIAKPIDARILFETMRRVGKIQ